MSKKILIIDDDPTILRMCESFLSAHGFIVTTAFDGEQGIEKFKAERPDLIVLDVQMPKMNGYTFVFELKKAGGSKTPIIVLTAKEGMAEIFKVEGVKEYMTKPLKPEVLLANIQKHI